MINDGKQLDLYIDESGSSAITEPRYKFFLISAVTLFPNDQELISLLFQKWRSKYLTNPNRCFHATDFFEKYIPKYKKKELKFARNFNKAVYDLVEILKYPKFKAEVYYVDIIALRNKFLLVEPPAFQAESSFKNAIEAKKYRESQIAYRGHMLKTIGHKNIFKPLALTLKKAFIFHSNQISSISNIEKGYINFESLSGSDAMLVKQYHRLKDKVGEDYGKKIVGINFHTKSSLDGGIELADLISYVSFQTLRFKFRRNNEYGTDLNPETIKSIKILRTSLRQDYEIKLVNVTNDIL